MRSAQNLLDELNAVDESIRIEAKRASDLGKSVLETVIAFANEPGLDGGYLLLGVDWSVNNKGDTVYIPAGLVDPDKIQKDLATQCATQLNVTLRPYMQVELVNGCALLVVYVPELESHLKPVYKQATGLPKGAYRRIGSTDQRCVDEDLWVLRGTHQSMYGPDSSVMPYARMEDFDPQVIELYRRERARVNTNAEELLYNNEDLLEALGAVRREGDQLLPTLAGVLLFANPIALRRLLPMVKIDYIRIAGLEWVEDPHKRFQSSIEVRKPLLQALSAAEASIIDDLPKGFHLPEGQLQSIQEPIMPRKIIREALANAVMHRTYIKHSPIQIVRYSNRIEIRNPGHSLKPMEQLGTPGSWPRNPVIAAVLHDLNLAEAKGTGIRSMRRLAIEAGLPLPEFKTDRIGDSFSVSLYLHNLINEDDHAWLRSLTPETLDEEEAKVLIYARATGAVDNAACRDFSGLDTLSASKTLRKLRDKGLLIKQGSGNRTYYILRSEANLHGIPPSSQLEAGGDHGISLGGSSETSQLLPIIPPSLQTRLPAVGTRPRQQEVRELILDLCQLQPLTANQLCQLLGRKDSKELRRTYLRPLLEEGVLKMLYPETENHPNQAYVLVSN